MQNIFFVAYVYPVINAHTWIRHKYSKWLFQSSLICIIITLLLWMNFRRDSSLLVKDMVSNVFALEQTLDDSSLLKKLETDLNRIADSHIDTTERKILLDNLIDTYNCTANTHVSIDLNRIHVFEYPLSLFLKILIRESYDKVQIRQISFKEVSGEDEKWLGIVDSIKLDAIQID